MVGLEAFGSGGGFESREYPFSGLDINLSVVEPGEPNCLTTPRRSRRTSRALGGCTLLVEARSGRSGSGLLHCPAGVAHVFVGAGDGPCVILMTGARSEDEKLLYPKSELAARYGASAEEETPDPKQAYAPFERPERGGPRTGIASPGRRSTGAFVIAPRPRAEGSGEPR